MYFGEKVRLRAIEMSDLPHIMKHWNTYETRKFLLSAVPYSENAERKWLEEVTTANPWKDGIVVFAVEDKRTGQFLGTVTLDRINPQNRRAELGIALHDPANLGKGYGTDTVRVMLWFGYHVLGLRTIFLITMVCNTRAIRAYEKAGFKKAGLLRQTMFSQGKFQDVFIMDTVFDEFASVYPGDRQIGSPV